MSKKEAVAEEMEVTEATEATEAKETVEAVETTVEQYMNEKVPFYAIYDGDRYKDDITVTVNGKTWQIQRGKHVQIPRFVFEAIMASERQKGVATATSQSAEQRFNDLVDNKIL